MYPPYYRYIGTFTNCTLKSLFRAIFSLLFFLRCRISEIDLPIFEFLGSNKHRFWDPLIKFGDFNLFPIFKNLFQIIGIRSKLLQLTTQFLLHLDGNLIRSLAIMATAS